jgi:capsular exopolysaccharide synthesis family protein
VQRRTQSAPSPGDDVVDLRDYAGVLRRRFRLILAVTAFVTALAAAYSFTRTPVYTATAVVLVQPATSSSQFRPDQLVSLDTEARLVKSEPVAEIAKETMGSALTTVELLKKVDVRVTPDTLVLDVAFTDGNAGEAADGANAFADAYLEYKKERAIAAAADDRKGIQDRIDELEQELADVDAQIDAAPPGSPEEQDAQRARDSITAQIAVLTSEFASSVVAETNPGEVILPAQAPTAPSSPKHVLNLAMGFLVGVFLGIVAAFVRDRTDDRITSRDDLEVVLDAPVLATIPHAAGLNRDESAWLVTEKQPRSPASEAYRTLRTAVMAMSRKRDLKIFAVVSPMLGEGKTTTTANLAVALSHTDSRVLVMSADLRRPSLHRYFEREAGVGLSDVLMGKATLNDAMEVVSPNLWLLTSGRPPARPAELLQSQAMPELFASLHDHFDFVLVDCPPVIGLADTLALAPFADAVILVARAESSKQGAIVHAVEQLEQVGAMIRGAVLNDVSLTRHGDAYGYGYGYAPVVDDEPTADRREPEGSGGGPGSEKDNGRRSAPRKTRNVRPAGGRSEPPSSERVSGTAAAPEAGARTDP